MTVADFASAVRSLPLTPEQSAAAEELLAAPPTNQLPRELIGRHVLTEFQVRMLLAGRGADLTVGRYAILDEIGGGGMGQVFKARDTVMGRVVALKLVRPERLAAPGALARFQQEIQAAARLAHPNIVRAYDAAAAGGRQFLVTEFIDGYDLGRELQRRGVFPAAEACDYARQAALGLQHAHEQGLVHRDIKPANLLFSQTDRLVKVADFGLARFDSPGSATGLTADGAVMGTPDYMAPEQANSAARADIRSDLYSLGCTLYQFLTGRVPFPVEGLMEKLRAHQSDEPEPLDDACPGLHPSLGAVVAKLMAKVPAARYQTPREAAEALIPFCPKPRSSAGGVSRPSLPATTGRSRPAVTTDAVASPAVETVPPSAVPPPEPAVSAPPGPVIPPGRKGWLIGGSIAAVILAAVLVQALNRPPKVDVKTGDTNVTVNAPPVNVTVKIDDWAKARDPGVVIYLNGAGLSAADRDKARTADEFARPMSLPPGRYTLVLKKDGADLEARAFAVTPESAGKEVATRTVAVDDPDGVPGEVVRWATTHPVTNICYLADGKSFAALGSAETFWNKKYQTPEVFEARSGGKRLPSNIAAEVEVLWVLPDGVSVCSGPIDGKFWESTTQASRLYRGAYAAWPAFPSGSTGAILSASGPPRPGALVKRVHLFTTSADRTRLAWAASPDPKKLPDQVKVVGVEPNRDVWKFSNPELIPASTACFVPGGDELLTAAGRTVRFHDLPRGRPLAPVYTGPGADVVCVAAATGGVRVAAGDGLGKVYIWDRGTVAPRHICEGHASAVNRLEFTLDGRRVVSAGEDGTVRVWDAAGGTEVAQYKHDGPVYALAMSPGGKRVLTGGADKTIRLWQLPE